MDWSRKHARQLSPGTATHAERADGTSRISKRMSRKRDISALREIDHEVGARLIHDLDPWVNFLQGLLVFGVGIWNVATDVILGWLMVASSLLFFAVGVWAIRWRWVSDTRHAYLKGQRLGRDQYLDDVVQSLRDATDSR